MRLDSKFTGLAVVLIVGLAAPAAAVGASSTVAVGRHSGDRSALTLSKSRRRALAKQHISIKVSRPATHPGSRLYFPQAAGKWNFANATGTLNYSGTVRLRDGKRSFVLSGLSFTRSSKGKSSVAAKSGRRKITLFTLTGRARIQKKGASETINGLSAHLSARAARLLNAALRHKVGTKNENLGSFVVTVSNTTGAARNGLGGLSGSPGGGAPGVSLSVAHALEQTLTQNGLAPVPIAPASGGLPAPAGTTTVPGADGTSLTLPAATGSSAGASFNDGTLTGTIPLTGGIQLGQGTGSVSLTNPVLTLGTGTEGSSLSFSVNGGPEAKLFDIDTSALEESATSNGGLSLSGLTAALSNQGAATINQAAGKQVVEPKETVGGLTVVVPASPGTS
ncbi:MAG TPA: hypothetical protein VMD09_16370 [Solirubrobacteraceae bacterium]|nr:hypothetical protein [Solirubrobacteraceae bacterium]